MTDEQYYTIDEIAKMLKVAYLTIYHWVQSSKLVAFKAGKQYQVKNKDLDSFVKSYKTIKEI